MEQDYISESPNPKSKCIDCSSELLPTARKCLHCGSYQDWRNYLSYGNTGVALIASVLALTGYLITAGNSAYSSLGKLAYPSKMNLAFSIIELSEASIQFAVKNISDESVAFSKIICSITAPTDSTQIARSFLRARSIGQTDYSEKFILMKSMSKGTQIATFALPDPILVMPGDAIAMTAKIEEWTLPLDLIGDNSELAPSSYCLIAGKSSRLQTH